MEKMHETASVFQAKMDFFAFCLGIDRKRDHLYNQKDCL
ncbi:hypothetical protein SD77_3934 [Bacillus badius]|uniref:Mobile element protein n=1 Tax=Bacillus badius TaxID=1455 RepID=A0ABR5AU79_BACBA|nr:hypothetical protein SD78_0915 [Bacillus badius]KIL78254.1 hypothetical protein SD77_3934 [Bacillus badius]